MVKNTGIFCTLEMHMTIMYFGQRHRTGNGTRKTALPYFTDTGHVETTNAMGHPSPWNLANCAVFWQRFSDLFHSKIDHRSIGAHNHHAIIRTPAILCRSFPCPSNDLYAFLCLYSCHTAGLSPWKTEYSIRCKPQKSLRYHKIVLTFSIIKEPGMPDSRCIYSIHSLFILLLCIKRKKMIMKRRHHIITFTLSTLIVLSLIIGAFASGAAVLGPVRPCPQNHVHS